VQVLSKKEKQDENGVAVRVFVEPLVQDHRIISSRLGVIVAVRVFVEPLVQGYGIGDLWPEYPRVAVRVFVEPLVQVCMPSH